MNLSNVPSVSRHKAVWGPKRTGAALLAALSCFAPNLAVAKSHSHEGVRRHHERVHHERVHHTDEVHKTPGVPGAFAKPYKLDAELTAAFNAHQRRTVDGRALLGPDAVDAAVAAFSRHGVEVVVRSTPWRLGPDQAELAAEWLTGWVGAAVEERPHLSGRSSSAARRCSTIFNSAP